MKSSSRNFVATRMSGSQFRSYEIWSLDSAEERLEFPKCAKEYVALSIGQGVGDWAYYQRYQGDKFYKLGQEDLAFMRLKGMAIPF